MNTISLFQSLLCSWSSEKCIHNQQHFGECMYVGFTIKARGNWHGIKIEAVAPNPNVLPLNSQDAVIHEFHIDSWSYTIVNLTKFIWRSPQVCSSWLSARSTRIIKGSQDHGAWNGAPSSRRAVGIVRKMWIGIRESGKRRNINVNATGLEKARMRIAGWEGSFKTACRKETKTLRLTLSDAGTPVSASIRPSGKPRGKYMEISVTATFYFSPRFRRPPSPYSVSSVEF